MHKNRFLTLSTKLSALRFALAALLLAAALGTAHAAETVGSGEPVIIGKPTAKITVHEYASLTCSHCADFFEKVLPQIKETYVNTGKIKFIYHDFPIDGLGLKAATLSRCMPPEQFYPFISVLYKNMMAWATAANPEKTLLQYATLGGLDEATAKACMNDTKKMDVLLAARTAANEKYGITGTPTFIFNDGEDKLVGDVPFSEFARVVDRLLKEKK